MRARTNFSLRLVHAVTLAAFLVGAGSTCAQDADDDPVSIGDSGAGYIDSAVIGNNARFRFDAAYDSNKPNRGEFIWAWTPPSANGPGRAESRVDYQRLSAYVEWAPSDDFSVFVDAPAVLSNPTINDNTAGFGDMEAGFKMAVCRECNTLVTFQMKTYLPTGDEKSGMGTARTGSHSRENSAIGFRSRERRRTRATSPDTDSVRARTWLRWEWIESHRSSRLSAGPS